MHLHSHALISLLCALPLAAQHPPFRQGRAPSLTVVVAQERDDPAFPAYLQALQSSNELIDLHVQIETRDGMPPRAWRVTRHDGSEVASGRTRIPLHALLSAIEAATGPSDVKRLHAFLERHPDHAEARRDLILALLERVNARLSRVPGKDPLPPRLDQDIWAELSAQLELFITSGDWLRMDDPVFFLLPPQHLGRSERIRSFFARSLPAALQAIHAFPDHPSAWVFLDRAVTATGDRSIPERCADTCLFSSPFQGMDPYVAQSVARLTCPPNGAPAPEGNLTRLKELWYTGLRPDLAFSRLVAAGPDGHAPNANELSQHGAQKRLRAWNILLAPLVAGLVRSGREGEAAEILQSLDTSWNSIHIDVQAASLAQKLDRKDLQAPWARIVGSLPEPVPAEGMLIPGLHLFLHRQRRPLDGYGYTNGFATQGIVLSAHGQTPDAWRSRLGWKDAGPHWALTGPSGDLLLEGGELPSREELLASFLALNAPTELGCIDQFRSRKGATLLMTAAKAGLHRRQYLSLRTEAQAPDVDPAARKVLRAGCTTALDQYLATLDELAEHPSWTSPLILRRLFPMVLPCAQNSPNDPMHTRRARLERIQSLLEEQLHRRPCDETLWDAWLSLNTLKRQNPVHLLERLSPSPLADRDAWPSAPVQTKMCEAFRDAEDWVAMIQLLKPRWEKAKADGRPWDWELARHYLAALIRTRQISDADALLDHYVSSSWGTGYLGDLCELAQALGHPAFADKWGKTR